jgi:hypothetical protein
MSTNPTPPRDPSDDWQLPPPSGGAPGQPPAGGPARGAWENDDLVPAPRHPPAAGGWLGGVGDALREPLGALWDDPARRPLVLLSLIALIGICGLSCFVLGLAVVSSGEVLSGPAALQPTAAPTVPITESINISANQTPVPVGVPSRMTLHGVAYAVSPMQVGRQNEWRYDAQAPRAAYWVPGALVNYVIGLPASDENRRAFEALRPGDLIVLDTAVGALRYRISELAAIPVDQPAALQDQTRPQITLVLLGEGGDTRRAAIAPYTDEGTANSLTNLGVPINLGDVRVRAYGERLVPGDVIGLPAGQNFYQVNVEVTSLVTRVLDATQFTSWLIDGAGQRHAASDEAARVAGGLGWTRGALSPGQTLTGTAGFQVPATMPGPNLEWNFAADPANPYVARVLIPYQTLDAQPTAAPTTAPVAEVTPLNVNISPEGNELRIVGNVRNLTDRFLNVSLRDISLTSGGAPIALNSSLPAFPWTITAGETLAFQITFTRPPPGQPAIFTMFGQSFQIDGL